MRKIIGAHLSCSKKKGLQTQKIEGHQPWEIIQISSQCSLLILSLFYVGFWLFILMFIMILSKYTICFSINKGTQSDNHLTLAHFDSWTLEK